MKQLMFLSLLASAFTLVANTPTIVANSVTLNQDLSSREVTVGYQLGTAPAIVTLDIQTNRGDGVYVSIGRDKLRHVWGDVNREVAVGAHEIKWQPLNDWPDVKISGEEGGVKAVVTAWSFACPPDYMVINLETANTVNFYVSDVELPESNGIADRVYKTSKMVLKKVHAGGATYMQGSPSFEEGRSATTETLRTVTFTRDFYLGVYPVTGRQWRYFAALPNNNVASDANHKNFSDWEVCPVSGAYDEIRGAWTTYNWPATKDLDTSTPSFIGWLRNRAGNRYPFDLPTSAQWEFACRAGTTSAYIDGTNNGANMGEYAWYGVNCSNLVNGAWLACDHEVGTKKPNNWGFYDMIGQHEEFVLDRYQNGRTADAVVDPESEIPGSLSDGSTRMSRGGNYRSTLQQLRSAAWGGKGSAHGNYGGVRVACPIPFAAE